MSIYNVGIMIDYYEYSIPELIKLLGTRFKDYRLRSHTITKFENGTTGSLSLGTFLLLMKAIGRIEGLDEIMPELPESAYLQRRGKKVQRIRHKQS